VQVLQFAFAAFRKSTANPQLDGRDRNSLSDVGMSQGFRFKTKPYDIRARVHQFVLAIIEIYPSQRFLPRPAARSWSQLFDAASSTGAHLEEADGGGTPRHFLSLNRGALREMREAKYWLGLIRSGRLEGWHGLGEIPDEAAELVAILAAIVRTLEAKAGESPESGEL
jgi:four helix bundle protein